MLSTQILQMVVLLELAIDEPSGIFFSEINQELFGRTLYPNVKHVLPIPIRRELLSRLFQSGLIRVKMGRESDEWIRYPKNRYEKTIVYERLRSCDPSICGEGFQYSLTDRGGVLFTRLSKVHWDRVFTENLLDDPSNQYAISTVTATSLERLKQIECSMTLINSFMETRRPINRIQTLTDWQPFYWHIPIVGYSQNFEIIPRTRTSLDGYDEFIRLRSFGLRSLWWREIGIDVQECRFSNYVLKKIMS